MSVNMTWCLAAIMQIKMLVYTVHKIFYHNLIKDYHRLLNETPKLLNGLCRSVSGASVDYSIITDAQFNMSLTYSQTYLDTFYICGHFLHTFMSFLDVLFRTIGINVDFPPLVYISLHCSGNVFHIILRCV